MCDGAYSQRKKDFDTKMASQNWVTDTTAMAADLAVVQANKVKMETELAGITKFLATHSTWAKYEKVVEALVPVPKNKAGNDFSDTAGGRRGARKAWTALKTGFASRADMIQSYKDEYAEKLKRKNLLNGGKESKGSILYEAERHQELEQRSE